MRIKCLTFHNMALTAGVFATIAIVDLYYQNQGSKDLV